MAKCSKCGAELLEGALFCTECGAALTEPFEGGNAKVSSNPFEDFDNKVPKPQVASELVFGETVYDNAVKAELKADEAAKIAQEAQAKAEANAKNAETNAKNTEENWHGQTGYGKPSFDGGSNEPPKPSFQESANTQGAWNASAEQEVPWGATGSANAQGAWKDNSQQTQGSWSEGSQQTQGAWSEKDQQNQQGWNAQQAYDQQFDQSPNQYNQGYATYGPTTKEKVLSILSYFSILAWIICFALSGGYKTEYVKQHFNASLILNIVGAISGYLGGTIRTVIGIAIAVYFFSGIVFAAQGKAKVLPPLDQIRFIR